MDVFELIDRNRREHGYTQMRLTQYKNFCNKKRRELRKMGDPSSVFYRLEANMAKFLLFKSPQYLHKNLRLLRGGASDFHELYRDYVTCYVAGYHKRLSMDALVCLRHKLADFYSFLNDIYQLCDNGHDFDQYKTKYQWNDITLLFETPRMAASFADGSFALTDNRFNTQLARKILAAQKALGSLKTAVQKDDALLLQVFDASRALHDCMSKLQQFLDDNYVVSEYTAQMLDDVSSVHGFVTQMVEHKSGQIHTQPPRYAPPALFRDCTEGLEALRKRLTVDASSLRSALIGAVERRLGGDPEMARMPFLPVFYDIAYDYIQYPPAHEGITQPLENMRISEESVD